VLADDNFTFVSRDRERVHPLCIAAERLLSKRREAGRIRELIATTLAGPLSRIGIFWFNADLL